MGGRKIGARGDHGAKGVLGVGRMAQLLLHIAQVDAGVQIAGRQGQRALDQHQRVIGAALLVQGHAQVVQRVGMFGGGGEDVAVTPFGVAQLALLMGFHGQAQCGVERGRAAGGVFFAHGEVAVANPVSLNQTARLMYSLRARQALSSAGVAAPPTPIKILHKYTPSAILDASAT